MKDQHWKWLLLAFIAMIILYYQGGLQGIELNRESFAGGDICCKVTAANNIEIFISTSDSQCLSGEGTAQTEVVDDFFCNLLEEDGE